MTHAQDDQVWRELRHGAGRGDLASPPVCTWLYASGATPLANSPAGFPVRADRDRVRRTHEVVERTVRRDDTVYLVRTQARAGGEERRTHEVGPCPHPCKAWTVRAMTTAFRGAALRGPRRAS